MAQRDTHVMDGGQVALTVTVVVKAENVEGAKRHATQRLNDWFLDGPSVPVEGFGFVNGTLLYWSFGTGADAVAELDDAVTVRAAA